MFMSGSLCYILVELAKIHINIIFFFKKDTFHPDKKLVAVKIMHLDYSRLGAQVHGCLFILFLTRAKNALDTVLLKSILPPLKFFLARHILFLYRIPELFSSVEYITQRMTGIQSYIHQRQQCVTCMVTSTKRLMKISFNGVKDKQPCSACNKTCMY